jgi:uncharacterized membrane protein YwaF
MHTLMVIAGGFVLLAAFLVVGKLANKSVLASRLFVLAWLLATLANLYAGVAIAGYTVAQELPIQLVVFAVPAITALVLGQRS